MENETINREESTAVGICARTNNSAPDMGMKIGTLWNDFYSKGICESINGKKNGKALCMYTNYESDYNGDYDAVVSCEADENATQPAELKKFTIPAGKYAKFIVKGHVQKAVMEFWQKLWEENLDRSYKSDFEEYQNSDMENAEIHIYIGLK